MTMGLFFKEFNVDKILESGAFKVWEEIKVGKEVFLELKSKDKEKDTVSVKVEKKGGNSERECSFGRSKRDKRNKRNCRSRKV